MNPTRLILALYLCSGPALAAPEPAEHAYQGARKGYYALKSDPKRRKFRDSWLTVAHRFEGVAKKYPTSGRAPDSLFTAAQLLSDLSRISLLAEDANASMEDYRTLLDVYPRNHLADDAALALARAHLDREQPEAARRVLQRAAQLPKGDQSARLRALAASLPPEPKVPARKPSSPAKVETAGGKTDGPPEARTAPASSPRETSSAEVHTQSPTRERVARAVETPGWLKEVTGKKAAVPSREADPAPPESREPEASAPPERAPAEEEDASETPTKPAAEPSPKRAVAGTSTPTPEATRGSGTPDAGALLALAPSGTVRERLRAIGKRGQSEVTLAEQLGLKVRRVVIDPGHGGHDNGTVGAGGTKEKDVALAIAKKLRTVLTEQGLEVALTRESDRFVRLEERARQANLARGDLFISVHCNSLPQRSIRGIETYTLNLASDRYAIRLAARENASSEKGMSDLRFLLADLATRANTEESVRLASRVQEGLVTRLTPRDRKIRDLGTKEALFYVLLGPRMPAILVETGFLSNAEEEKRLASSAYQDEVARAIAAGVQDFLGNRDRLAKAN